VTETSHALDLEPDVFKKRSASDVARSLKRSAERSRARKSDPYRSAMSMLTFYINRAGSQLSAERKRTLTNAKSELRKLYGR
jgi:cob(I)alamin adenosyltransferase